MNLFGLFKGKSGEKPRKLSDKEYFDRIEQSGIRFPLPYRALTNDERGNIQRAIKGAPFEVEFAVWRSTIPAAQERMKQIEGLGYSVIKEDYIRFPLEFAHIRVGGYDVGSMDLWCFEGLTREPVHLYFSVYDKSPEHWCGEQIGLARKLGEDLTRANIPFSDGREHLKERARELKAGIEYTEEAIAWLEGFIKRTDKRQPTLF